MPTVHLVSHTHWDREWYQTFQQFRLRLVHLVDGLLRLLAADGDFRHFMLDGQTIVLDDYLAMRPEAESRLRSLVEEGRLLIGPWHILPDMFLVGPEAHIRNLLEGDRQARRFGGKMPIGYMPDSFGHIGQMPQILRGFGIDNACLWRGVDDQPTEFWWQSPDGSQVLMLYLRDSYSNGASLTAGSPEQFAEQLKQAADSLAPHSFVSDVLVMYGTDHMEPPRETSNAIQAASSQLTDYCIVHSTLPDYLASVRAQLARNKPKLPTIVGELRSSKRSHLLPGVLSTRMWIKQRNQACETLLEKWAEPFSTFALAAGLNHGQNGLLEQPGNLLATAWRLLMECHPHDSICGCSIDQVHDEMKTRFDQVEQIGEEIARQSLDTLAAAIDTRNPLSSNPRQSAVVVFNASSVSRTDFVHAEISLPSGVSDFEIVDESGQVIPHQSASGKSLEVITVRLRREELGGLLSMVHDGRVGNLAIQALHLEHDGATVRVEAVLAENAEPNAAVWEDALRAVRHYQDDESIEWFDIRARSPESANVSFNARDVPGLGWKTYHVRPAASKPAAVRVTPLMRLLAPIAGRAAVQALLRRLSRPIRRHDHTIENEHLSVTLNQLDGTLTVVDKATGRVYRGMNRFVDSGDCGDTYNFCPPLGDSVQDRARLLNVEMLVGPVQQSMTISLRLRVPAGLTDDRRSRVKQMVDMPITTTVVLTNGVPRVDIHTRVENHARDHRLRAHFPAPFRVRRARHDGHFEVVERATGVPQSDSSWAEQPRPEVPQRAFTSISDGTSSLTIASRGLPEVEVLHDERTAGSQIALTLLRCVGWLSRDDFTTRQGHAGPFLATPKAQMPGIWEFDYSVVLAPGEAGERQARNFEVPLRGRAADMHAGSLPASGSFVTVDNPSFIVSAVKQAEDRQGWIVRGFNVTDAETPVTITPWRRFARVELVSLAEEITGEPGSASNGAVTVKAGAHEIVSLRFAE